MDNNSREQVLRLLQHSDQEWLSGTDIGRKLGITRAAVSKIVQKLCQQGYPIESAHRVGYRLADRLDELSEERMAQYLRTGHRIEIYQHVDSTNALLKHRARMGEAEGLVAIADRQTAGRGRKGRTFSSPPGAGLYMSILLRPKIAAQEALSITTRAAVAVAQAIESLCGKRVGIKWVNDLILDGRKVTGILTEAAVDLETGGVDYAVLGIGVNVREPAGGYPPEIQGIAGAIYRYDEEAPIDVRCRLAAEILWQFETAKNVLEAYRARSVLTGKNVEILPDGGHARVLGIDEAYGLVVEMSDGGRRTLSSGEVSVRQEAQKRTD